MRFAILGSRGFPSTYGGFETFVRTLAPELVARGHSVLVYGRGGAHTSQVVEGVQVVSTIGIDSKSLSTLSYGATAAIDLAVRGADAALVVNVANGYFLPALRARRIPTLLNVDGLEWERAKWSRLGRAVFRSGARCSAANATELVADSQAIADVWHTTFGRRPIFIPYGAPVLEHRETSRVEGLGLAPQDYILVVARLVPENNVDVVLSAVELLGTSMSLVVVGSSAGPSSTERRLRELGQQGRVVWLGHVDDQELLADLWFHSAIYIHGHSVGGTNPALLQALGAGAPTIAFDSPYNREVLAAGARFFSDSEELATELDEVAADPALRSELRNMGRARIGAAYQWSDVCDSYEAALTALAAGR